jgi:uncharacterized protein
MAVASSNADGLLTVAQGTLRLDLKLTPKAKKSAITGSALDAEGRPYLKVSVTAAPESGKANAALIKLLAKEWGIAKSHITIIRGTTNTRKTIEIADKIDTVRPLIMVWLNEHQF